MLCCLFVVTDKAKNLFVTDEALRGLRSLGNGRLSRPSSQLKCNWNSAKKKVYLSERMSWFYSGSKITSFLLFPSLFKYCSSCYFENYYSCWTSLCAQWILFVLFCCIVSVFSRKRYQGSSHSFSVPQWLCLPNQHNLACFAVRTTVRDHVLRSVQTTPGWLAGLV